MNGYSDFQVIDRKAGSKGRLFDIWLHHLVDLFGRLFAPVIDDSHETVLI